MALLKLESAETAETWQGVSAEQGWVMGTFQNRGMARSPSPIDATSD